eukprot:SAG11_NODE_1125_length_5773_cov_1.928974_4_plen_99_part_00
MLALSSINKKFKSRSEQNVCCDNVIIHILFVYDRVYVCLCFEETTALYTAKVDGGSTEFLAAVVIVIFKLCHRSTSRVGPFCLSDPQIPIIGFHDVMS